MSLKLVMQYQSKANVMTFICSKIPFVWQESSLVFPFVCENIPSVGNKAFHRGFTIIELLIVLTLIAILAAVAGPSFLDFIKNNRLTAQTNDLLSDLSFARSEAIKRGGDVTLCATGDATAATPTCSGSPSWTTGRLVFVDADRDGNLDTGELILRKRVGLGSSANILNTLDATTSSGSYTKASRVTFSGQGTASAGTGNHVLFALCDDRGPQFGKQIEVLVTGLTRSAALSTGSCS